MQSQHYMVVEQPAAEPVTYDDMAMHLRVDSDDDESYITALISVAREWVESITGLAGIETQFRMVCRDWEDAWHAGFRSTAYPFALPLYRCPLVSVDSVKYYASGEETLTTLDPSNWRELTGTHPGMVQVFQNIPGLADRPDAVQVEFTAGHEDADGVPAAMKHAIKLMAAHLYDNRVPVIGSTATDIPYSLISLCNNLKIGGWC